MLFADTSALAKLVMDEPESVALRAYLVGRGPIVASAIAATELVRVVRRLNPGLEGAAQDLLDTLTLVDLNAEMLTAAATLPPPAMRTLDAIHLATALAVGAELDAVLTYDARMAEAARAVGLRTEAPA